MIDKKLSGMGIADYLLLIFITLKLIGEIDWSWWWIMSPMWGSIIIATFLKLTDKNNKKT